jgi:L,D-peptidoglycan transpeptidase YkuD (ErfK/YbiS/YcfS/YnhG family)
MTRRRCVAAAIVVTIVLPACGSARPEQSASTTERAAAAPRTTIATVPAAAVATVPATRVDPPLSTCQQIATTVAAAHTTQQVLIVRTETSTDTTAVATLATLTNGTWQCGADMVARVGRTGVRPLLDRRSGDGTTPAGVFPLATMIAYDGERFSFFGNSPDPGVTAGPYRRVKSGDCFGATPNTAGYGHLRKQVNCPGPDDEYLPSIGAYAHAALIGANMEPNVSGDAPGEIPYASAIFLHRHAFVSGSTTATKPTSGCVSLSLADLAATLTAMRADVQFAIGTTAGLLAGNGN